MRKYHEAPKDLELGSYELEKMYRRIRNSIISMGLTVDDMPFDWSSVEGVIRVVRSICGGTANNVSWIRHTGSEIDRLIDLLEDFERRAPTMVTIKKVVDESELERAKRRLQPKRYFGRNRARPVRIHWGFA